MTLTSTTTVDLVNQIQTLTYYDPGQVDQITFSTNTITFSSTSGYNLVKSDALLFIQFLNLFNNLLVANFPQISNSRNLSWPLGSNLEITETTSPTHIMYAQTSAGTEILGMNYVPLASAVAIAARGTVSITLQEFLSMVYFLNQYYNQVNLN